MAINTLPSPLSIWPADRAKLAAVTWRHTSLTLCPTCHGPALVGYLHGAPLAYACQRCPEPEKPRYEKALDLSDGVGQIPMHG